MKKDFLFFGIPILLCLGYVFYSVNACNSMIEKECPKGFAHCLGKDISETSDAFQEGLKEGSK